MQIYNTKYLFTDGITVHEAEIKNDMAIIREGRSYALYLHGKGREWHTEKEGALKRAEELRIKKLQSLDKQMKKISALTFTC